MLPFIERLKPQQGLKVTLFKDSNEWYQYTCTIQFVSKGPPSILLPLPGPDCPFLSQLQKGLSVMVELPQTEGLFQFASVIERFQFQPQRGLWLHLPEDSESYEVHQRRQWVRVPWRFPVELSLPSDTGANEAGEWERYDVEAVDLSAGGLRVKGSPLLEPGQEVRLGFQVPSPIITVETLARVVFSTELAEAGLHSSFAYKDLPPNTEQQIVAACFQRQLAISRT